MTAQELQQFRTFWSPWEQYKDRIGQAFSIVRKLTDDETGRGPEEEDGDSEPMYLIRFESDGVEITAWQHEIFRGLVTDPPDLAKASLEHDL